jgi:hypothetical protein
LESADNLTEGRWLLEQAFETTKQSLPESRWPSLQKPFAQNLATFQYFLAEAADVSGDDAVTLAETVDRQKTKLSQDHRRLSLLREAMSGIGR